MARARQNLRKRARHFAYHAIRRGEYDIRRASFGPEWERMILRQTGYHPPFRAATAEEMAVKLTTNSLYGKFGSCAESIPPVMLRRPYKPPGAFYGGSYVLLADWTERLNGLDVK